eukprot:CAMPEP_0172473022 /NCGR_PEP_ID=MMETSP1065-20121228/68644_1 /TAXON_ID=265537 /ORGANISM="Amphiprora paludosa, Strain CCMP125" /LENGTH=561 /DNA_ID=CAMNT_0013231191 /DNA_START=23 /DNA_END=1708 /DNA_ORIENTATION=-
MGNRLSSTGLASPSSTLSSSSSRSFRSGSNSSRSQNETGNGNSGNCSGAYFSPDDAACVVSELSLDHKLVKQLTRDASSRRARDLKRLSLLSCTLGLDYQDRFTAKLSSRRARDLKRLSLLSCTLGLDYQDRFTAKLALTLVHFLQEHAPQLEQLSITGPMLLETNQQACQLLQALLEEPEGRGRTNSWQPFTSLERLTLCIGQTANVALGNRLSQLIVSQSSLTHLELRHVSWRKTASLQALSQGLAQSSSLRHVDLSNCRIVDQGFQAFIQALTNSSTSPNAPLETLHLQQNALTSATLVDLTQLVQTLGPTLQTLSLSEMPLLFSALGSNNDDESASLEAFFQVLLAQTHALRELALSATGMNIQVLKVFLKQLVALQPPNLQRLNLSHNVAISRGSAMELLIEYLPLLPPNLESLLLVVEPDTDDADDDHDLSSSQETIRSSFLNVLSQTTQLTQFQLVRREDGLDEGIAPLSFFVQTQAIVERNRLMQRLNVMEATTAKATTSLVPASVWPHFLARVASAKMIKSNGRKSLTTVAAHPPSIIHQVLERHLVQMTNS